MNDINQTSILFLVSQTFNLFFDYKSYKGNKISMTKANQSQKQPCTDSLWETKSIIHFMIVGNKNYHAFQ